MSESIPQADNQYLEPEFGEDLVGVDSIEMQHSWVADLHRIVDLIPSGHDIVAHLKYRDNTNEEVIFPVEDDPNSPGKKTVIITAAAAAVITAAGIAAYRRGIVGPKARKTK